MSAPRSIRSSNPNRLIVRGRARIAIRLARLFPCVEVMVFEDDWIAVDRARATADALGLSNRVHIHHVSATPPGLDLPPPRLPRRAA